MKHSNFKHFLLIVILAILVGCKDKSISNSTDISVNLTINSSVGYSPDGPLATVLGTIEEISRVTVDVKDGAAYLITDQEISKSENSYSGVLTGLPIDTTLTFIAHAYNGNAVEIYSNSSFPVSQSLSGVDDAVSLFLAPIDDGQSVELPHISKIEHEQSVERGMSIPIRIWVTATVVDDVLTIDLSGSAFGFSPATGSLTTYGLNRFFMSTITASTSVGAGSYELSAKVTNEQGNFIEAQVSIDILNPYLLPDSGHTANTTATWGEDADYSLNLLSYTDNSDGTVTDNITGLTWQQTDDAQTRTMTLAADYCNTLNLGGYTDWRLPSVMELKDIVDYDAQPAIDTSVFLGSVNANFWTGTILPNDVSKAIYIDFGTATQSNKATSTQYSTRCVRGLPVIFSNLKDNGDGTVVDLDTNLTWQQAESGAQSWEAAINYCEGVSLGGGSDWRLPNAKELQTLYNYSITGSGTPKVDATLFPGAIADNYWTSTTYGTTTKAWHIDFDTADFGVTRKDSATIYARCVRSTN